MPEQAVLTIFAELSPLSRTDVENSAPRKIYISGIKIKFRIKIFSREHFLYIQVGGVDIATILLRAARILLIGVGGLGSEVAKNIVLSGVNSITLLDSTKVTEEDACSQFLVSREDVGKNRAECSKGRTQLLNPMVDVQADNSSVDDKDDEFFTEFDVLCALCCKMSQLHRINKICADNNVKFYAGDVFGFYGYMFADLGFHEYAEEVPKPKKKEEKQGGEHEGPAEKKAKTEMETVIVKKAVQFTLLKDALDYQWGETEAAKKLKRTPNTFFIVQVLLQFMEKLNRRPSTVHVEADKKELMDMTTEVLERLGVKKDFLPDDTFSYCFAELSPVCAVVGGVLGQEIIKAVSQRDPPHNNFFFYNGVNGEGLVDKIGS